MFLRAWTARIVHDACTFSRCAPCSGTACLAGPPLRGHPLSGPATEATASPLPRLWASPAVLCCAQNARSLAPRGPPSGWPRSGGPGRRPPNPTGRWGALSARCGRRPAQTSRPSSRCDAGHADAVAFAVGAGLTRLVRVRLPPIPRRGLGRLARARPAFGGPQKTRCACRASWVDGMRDGSHSGVGGAGKGVLQGFHDSQSSGLRDALYELRQGSSSPGERCTLKGRTARLLAFLGGSKKPRSDFRADLCAMVLL